MDTMTGDGAREQVDVLLVEDNPGDVRLIEEAIQEGRIATTLHVVTDGADALDFLFQRGSYSESPRPDLVLLDLNLPKVDGRSVLEEIGDDADLKLLPVVVLTSSEARTDVVRSYELRANAYVTKPVSPDDFIDLVRTIEEFWFGVVRLPPKPE